MRKYLLASRHHLAQGFAPPTVPQPERNEKTQNAQRFYRELVILEGALVVLFVDLFGLGRGVFLLERLESQLAVAVLHAVFVLPGVDLSVWPLLGPVAPGQVILEVPVVDDVVRGVEDALPLELVFLERAVVVRLVLVDDSPGAIQLPVVDFSFVL